MTEFRDTEGQSWEMWSLNPLGTPALWTDPWMELGFLATRSWVTDCNHTSPHHGARLGGTSLRFMPVLLLLLL